MSETSLRSPPIRRGDSLGAVLKQNLGRHAWLLGYGLAYIGVVAGVLWAAGLPVSLGLGTYVLSALLPPAFAVAFIVFGHGVHHLAHVRPLSLQVLAQAVRTDDKFTIERAAHALFPLLLIPLFSSAFTSFKNAIPHIVPFSYDRLFMEVDRWLHFGHHPWALLQPMLGHPLATSAISYLYNLWLPLMYLILCWQIFSTKDQRLRMQYLISFVVAWSLLGSLLALFMSSAGPCFYEYFVAGPNPYAPLMDYLRAGDLQFKNWSLEAQAYLWTAYSSQEIATGGGISAMPSLHIAIGVLQALMAWRMSRKLGWLLSAYAGVLLIGSVHLGWHYAIDGYLAAILAVILWKIIGRVLRHHPDPAIRAAGLPSA